MKLTWDDPEDIALELLEKHPDVEPLSLSFVKLHEMVVSLKEFDDDPKGSSEGKLEAIQMVWLEEFQEA